MRGFLFLVNELLFSVISVEKKHTPCEAASGIHPSSFILHTPSPEPFFQPHSIFLQFFERFLQAEETAAELPPGKICGRHGKGEQQTGEDQQPSPTGDLPNAGKTSAKATAKAAKTSKSARPPRPIR